MYIRMSNLVIDGMYGVIVEALSPGKLPGKLPGTLTAATIDVQCIFALIISPEKRLEHFQPKQLYRNM